MKKTVLTKILLILVLLVVSSASTSYFMSQSSSASTQTAVTFNGANNLTNISLFRNYGTFTNYFYRSPEVEGMEVFHGSLYCYIDQVFEIWKLDLGTNTWMLFYTPPDYKTNLGYTGFGQYSDNNILLFGVSRLIWRYDGVTAQLIDSPASTSSILSFTSYNGYIYAGEDDGSLIQSSDNGLTWVRVWQEPNIRGLHSLEVYQGKLFIGTYLSTNPVRGDYYYTYDGTAFTQYRMAGTDGNIYSFMKYSDNCLLAGWWWGGFGRIYYSNDGVTWHLVGDMGTYAPKHMWGVGYGGNVYIAGEDINYRRGAVFSFSFDKGFHELLTVDIGILDVCVYGSNLYFGSSWSPDSFTAEIFVLSPMEINTIIREGGN